GMEPRSNSMRAGAHAAELAPSLRDADAVVLLQRPELVWDAQHVTGALGSRGRAAPSVAALVAALREQARAGDHVVFMSNGGFGPRCPRKAPAQESPPKSKFACRACADSFGASQASATAGGRLHWPQWRHRVRWTFPCFR